MNRYTWSIHTVEYYLALKRKEVLTSATTWMNLEDVMLSERSQTQKDTHCLVPLTGSSRGIRSTETGSRWWGQGLGKGTGSQCFMGSVFHGVRVSVWEGDKVLEMMGWLHDNVNVLNAIKLCTQK